jgi:hypothetical protein
MTGFTPEQTATILERDNHKCPICDCRATTANHRANRGAGGHKAGNRISNGCAICWKCNGLIESDPTQAALARELGVKLSRYDNPLEVPYFHPMMRMWVFLADDGSYTLAETETMLNETEKTPGPALASTDPRDEQPTLEVS